MATPLLATKLSIPPAPHSLVRRARLLDRLDEGCRRKLTLVSAPAGSGKTTLVAEWVAAARLPVAWVSLDEHDNDLSRFWTYVITALGNLRAGAEAAPVPPPGLAQTPEDALAEVVNEVITGIPGDFILALDDYHLITQPWLHHSLTFLLDHSPATMHVVIVSREDPPLPLALLRARGQLVEVRAGELSFTAAETMALLHQMMGPELPAAALETLQARTEGWAAGLQLAALSMREGADPGDFARTFRGTHRYIVDYLAEQVLQRQDPGVQRFLLDTCILERLSGPLCAAVMGSSEAPPAPRHGGIKGGGGFEGAGSSQAMLERLERANLFLVPLDSERRWYRYHQLFADFLRDRPRQAEPGRWPELHARAARWFEQQGDAPQAFEHWMRAGDLDAAARLAAEAGKALLKRGEVRLLLSWTEQLPRQVLRERPWLGIFRAWALAVSAQVADREECLRAVEQRIPREEALADPRQRELLGEVAAVRAYCAASSGESQQALALARAALEDLPVEEGSTRSVVYLTLGSASISLNDPCAAADAFQEAARVGREAGNLHAAVPATCNLGEIKARQGRLHEAMATFQDALRLGMGLGAQPLPFCALAHAGVADIMYQWNDLEAAARHAEKALALSRRWAHADAILRGCHTLAWIYRTQGHVEGAQALLQDCDKVLRQHAVLPQNKQRWAAQQMRWWIAQGQHSRATRLAEEHGLSPEAELTYANEAEYASLARLLLAQSQIDQALRLLARLLEAAGAAGRTGRVIEALMLRALALQARGENAQAWHALARALTLAEPEGYVRLFVDEGPALAPLLQQIHRAGNESLAGYAGRLLAACGAEGDRRTGRQPAALIEPLNKRETQILRLIAAGKTYQEIARELIIAVSTVQSHVKSLYPKLGVHSGLEAVARARQLGLLPP